MGPFYYSDIFLSLANEMQQSNGKLHFPVRNKNSPFDKSIESIELLYPFSNGLYLTVLDNPRRGSGRFWAPVPPQSISEDKFFLYSSKNLQEIAPFHEPLCLRTIIGDGECKSWDPQAPMIWDNFSFFRTNCTIQADPRTCCRFSDGCCHIVWSNGKSCEEPGLFYALLCTESMEKMSFQGLKFL